jgi:hypothetical protein
MGNKFLEKFAPFYFLIQSMGWVPVVGTLLGLFVWITQGKKLQHGTRSMYLVMALWAVFANGLVALILFLMLTADPTTATEVQSM